MQLPDQTISIKRLHQVIVEKSDLYVGLDADDHEGMIDLLKEKVCLMLVERGLIDYRVIVC